MEKRSGVELKRRVDSRIIFGVAYVLVAIVYLVIGFLPAEAESYEVSGKLRIPRISLVSDVTEISLEEEGLKTPNYIVGSFSRAENKTLLIGHSTTAFSGLWRVFVGDTILYDGREYEIVTAETVAKDQINMNELLLGEEKETLVVMTCAGELLADGDATHRLILTAEVVE